jgi:transcriptional regulator with XRE-family HTH domain
MTTFGILLRDYRERAGMSQKDLAVQAGLSTSTISRVESGERGPPSKRRQVMALAKVLGLRQNETDALLSAADFAPSTAPELALHPRDETLYRVAQELEALRTDPEITPAQVRFVEETLLLILRGARAALPTADLAVVPSGTPTARALSEEERYLDDLLGDCMAGRAGGSMPFTVFAAVARSPRWELKRRLAEALPSLLEHAAGSSYAAWTVPLMETLRDDPPDPQWRTDIRRRAIEAAPTLWRVRPEAVPPLLRWREGDEVYAVLGTLDALASIGDEALTNEIRADLLAHTEVEHRRAVALYAELLDRSVLDPDAALRTIDEHREDPERLVRVCLARSLRHLLSARPAETLKEMRYFLRRRRGAPASAPPVEHQNVRRAVARHPAGLIALLDSAYDESALHLLRTLAADQDVHVRRALSDALAALVERAPQVALDLIYEYLLPDRDRFVQERTWNALRQLMSEGSERAEELCARLIEIA